MKRKRAWWFIGGFALIVALVTFVFMSQREHPDYKRAAERLPEARKRAEELIGPMTWEEYRKLRGVEASDDFDEWIALEASIPQVFQEYDDSWIAGATAIKVEDVFHAAREWLFSLSLQLEPLRLTRPILSLNQTDFTEADLSSSYGIMKSVRLLILGAADAGDAAAVREAGKVAWMIIERQIEEFDLLCMMTVTGGLAGMQENIVWSAVRNRRNPTVMEALSDVMADKPEIPSFRDAIIGEARSHAPLIEEMRSLSSFEIENWLNQWFGANVEYPDGDFIGAWIRSAMRKLPHDEPISNRGVGEHTAAALEARYWEAIVECAELSEHLSYTDSDGHLRLGELGAFYDSYADRSYELAAIFIPTGTADFSNRDLALSDARVIGLELISRYPNLEDLPAALPVDLVTPDAFGGEPLLYRKTPHGFLIYTRYRNRVDDGFIPLSADYYEIEARSRRSVDAKDWGLIVSYDDPDPLP